MTTANRAKPCHDCGDVKPLSNFEKNGSGYRNTCKTCRAARRKEAAKTARANHKPADVPMPIMCDECGKGAEEVDFKWRSDVLKGGWRSTCNACLNAKDYSKTYRARQRAIDEAAFLARNAKIHLEWARRNPEAVRQQQVKIATIPDRKIKQIRTSAAARGVTFAEKDADAMRAKLLDPCFYCNFEPGVGEMLNGLDRIDSNKGYTDDNTVACCCACNAMKGALSVDEFIINVRKVAVHDQWVGAAESAAVMIGGGGGDGGEGGGVAAKRCRLPPFSYNAERREAEKVDKTDQLAEGVRLDLYSGACYLCGRTPALGIDRVNSRLGYVPNNVRSCCTDCNYMKKDLDLEDFMGHVRHIHAHAGAWVLGDVMDLPLKTATGVIREPVAALDADNKVMIIFPSMVTAEGITRYSRKTIRQVAQGAKSTVSWGRATPAEYRSQTLSASQCMRAISYICSSK